ncbi:MAG TPA: DNA repair protein RecN [Candidatus Limnocylindrales bacterium]|nr:DNA repair protein RecN [Candidatus Limnocylindrales bacterium]
MNVGRLLELSVADLALIDRLRLELAPGLNVLTGETGAGKSLVIDALGLAIGARADTSLVRHGAETARVTALFDRLPEPLIAVREVSVGGRSTARLDDEAVTAARLADVAGPLVEIHGQHEQQRLLDERWQRDLLDAFGGHEELRAGVAAAVDRWRANRAALAELELDPRELTRRLELNEHEAAEIAAARLKPGEAAEIRSRLDAAQHGEAIARGSATVHDALAAEEGGARDPIAIALREARALERLDRRFAPLAERLAGLEAELDDVASTARELAETVDHDPAELARLEERLSTIYALERRYGDDEEAVIAHGERAAAEAERLRTLDAERELRQAEAARLLEAVGRAAAALSEARTVAAAALSAEVGLVLEELGFPAGVFEVVLGRRPADEDEPAVEVDGDALAFDGSGIDHDPAELARLEERLSVIFGLERRYGDDEAAVIAHGERAAAEAERLRGVDDERARRAADDARLLGEVGFAAAALSSLRVAAARSLESAVGGILVELGFPEGVFEVALGRRPAGPKEAAVEIDGDALAFDGSGIDQVVYRLAPNPGEPPRPLARIASGGEMSRVALAIKQVLADADETPTLVFDEVDTGIGGRSADPIGRRLWTLARRHQVLCVTHLPQIAAHADAHFHIAKSERDGRTVTDVTELDREGRIVELAQMLAGSGGGTAALASARELLDRAEAWQASLASSG